MDTDTPTTDLVIIDAEIVEDTNDSGNSLAHTVTTTAATSAVILVAMVAYKFLKPKVTSLIHRSKTDEPEETVDTPVVETPETAEV